MEATSDYLKKFWDDYSDLYHDNTNTSMRSLMMSLIGLLRIKSCKRILEAGCGPGLTSKMLVADMSEDAVAYCVDLAPKMIQRAVQNFEKNKDFNSNQDNHWELFEPKLNGEEKLNIEADIEATRKEKNKSGKIIKFMEGDTENMPFSDGQFDCVVSSLVLMLPSDAEKMLKECYRVLANGGMAGFSVFGKVTTHRILSIYISTILRSSELSPPSRDSPGTYPKISMPLWTFSRNAGSRR